MAGRLQLLQGQPGGKLLLTRALKVAHNAMTNHQLVSQVCERTCVLPQPADDSLLTHSVATDTSSSHYS